MTDIVERVIACARKEDIDDPSDWLARHEAQAEDDDVSSSEVQVGGGGAFCVSYEPDVPLDIHWPTERPWGESVRDSLHDLILAGTYARVSIPARVGCDYLFADSTDFPKFDNEIGDPYHMAYTTVCMKPEDYLRIQYQMVRSARDSDFSTWLMEANEDRVQSMENTLATSDSGVPRPFLWADEEGRLIDWQEGRHRALAAFNNDEPFMDVYVFVTHRRDDGRPEYKYPDPPEWPEKEF